MIEEKNLNNNIIQNILVENREKMNVSGVLDVLSFDDRVILMETELGLLTVKGEKLKVNKLNLESEEVIIDGVIQNLSYSDTELGKNKNKNNLFSKIFK